MIPNLVKIKIVRCFLPLFTNIPSDFTADVSTARNDKTITTFIFGHLKFNRRILNDILVNNYF